MPAVPQHDAQSNSAIGTTWSTRGRSAGRPTRSRELQALSPADSELPRPHGADYVTIPVAAAMTGYSAKAIRRKIESGVWLEGREFRRAPDGHVLISVKGYESWVERGRA